MSINFWLSFFLAVASLLRLVFMVMDVTKNVIFGRKGQAFFGMQLSLQPLIATLHSQSVTTASRTAATLGQPRRLRMDANLFARIKGYMRKNSA